MYTITTFCPFAFEQVPNFPLTGAVWSITKEDSYITTIIEKQQVSLFSIAV